MIDYEIDENSEYDCDPQASIVLALIARINGIQSARHNISGRGNLTEGSKMEEMLGTVVSRPEVAAIKAAFLILQKLCVDGKYGRHNGVDLTTVLEKLGITDAQFDDHLDQLCHLHDNL